MSARVGGRQTRDKMDEEEAEDKGYVWEAEYERPWEALQEDTEGRILAPDDDGLYKAKRRKLFDYRGQIKLGMMRHVYVVIDMSSSMDQKDLRPDRLSCTKVILESFLEEFFDQNPISQMGLLVTRNGRAEKITDLSGNPRQHKEALTKCNKCSGEASLQNALEISMKYLRHLPTHSSREVIVIHGSLTSCDPDNIFKTIEEFSAQNMKCSIIGLAAEVNLCHTICKSTQGTYGVVMDESHFKDLLMKHCRPPLAMENAGATLIKMGFPHHISGGPLALCICHLDSKSGDYVTTSGYFCPQCQSKYCELPVECKICGLTLVLAPHLARSYHHLFPLPMFKEIKLSERLLFCASCQLSLESEAYVCPLCSQPFCIDCDLYCHETLHNCPGCQSKITQV